MPIIAATGDSHRWPPLNSEALAPRAAASSTASSSRLARGGSTSRPASSSHSRLSAKTSRAVRPAGLIIMPLRSPSSTLACSCTPVMLAASGVTGVGKDGPRPGAVRPTNTVRPAIISGGISPASTLEKAIWR